jgi:hypothetical protein
MRCLNPTSGNRKYLIMRQLAVGKMCQRLSPYLTACLEILPWNLEGQCHEMVVEIRPWSGKIGLN